MSSDLVFYGELLVEIKDRIRQGQTRATLSANAEMIAMYWDIGRMIHKRQKEKGWGAGVIPRLACRSEKRTSRGQRVFGAKYRIHDSVFP